MTWEQVFNKLAKEETVHVGAEAFIGAKLKAKIGDVPFYNIMAAYVTEEGYKKEEVHTLAELQEIVEREPAFIKCNTCGEIVDYDEGYWADHETGRDYHDFDCLSKEMEQKHGCGAWRVIAYKSDVDIDDLEKMFEMSGEEYLEYQKHLKEEIGKRPVVVFDKLIFDSEDKLIGAEDGLWSQEQIDEMLEKCRIEIPFPNNDIIKAIQKTFLIRFEVCEKTGDTEGNIVNEWGDYDIEFVQRCTCGWD